MGEESVRRPRVFSGIKPSGVLTLGNYLGAIRRWVAEQDAKENFYCIVDMHAITVYQDPEPLRRRTRDVAAIFFAMTPDLPTPDTMSRPSHVTMTSTAR